MTEKIYYENPYAREFDAEITSQTEHDGRYHVILNQSLFYPSGGGQPCDTGFINDAEVIEVFENGDDIVHVLQNQIEDKENKNVHGVLNWERRFEMMQQHLGEHIFAGCLYNLFQLHTLRMRIEGDNVSIDLDIHADENMISEAEAAANKAVWENIPVEILYPEINEIKTYARKQPPENAVLPIRIVKIEGIDYVPCCGLHVSSTGQVGLVKITSYENHKGGTRIYLKCGSAAYRWLRNLHNEVRKAESELVCGYEGINEKILNLKSQIHDLKITNEKNIDRFLTPLAENLISNSENNFVRHVFKNSDSNQEEVKRLFKILTENNHDIVALLACENSDGVFLTFGTHRDNKKIDVRAAFKRAIEILDGRGGGSPFCAQGWGKNSKELDFALDEAEKIINK